MSQFVTVPPGDGRRQRLLIVQPWFSAIGHPAQSLFNTMRTLTRVAGIDYLVSEDPEFEHHADLAQALGKGQRLFRFRVSGSVLKENTVQSLLSMLKLSPRLRAVDSVLFFDMELSRIAKWWPWLFPFLKVRQLSVLYLLGPEHFAGQGSARRRLERLLRRKEVVLCLRTEELRQEWIAAFPHVAPDRIRTLPSLEIPEGLDTPVRHCEIRADLRLGLLGQVRRGKSIDSLVPLFVGRPELGVLKIAGSFASPEEKSALGVLQDFPAFEERYFSDDELLQMTAAQDYIVILYDQWDKRMESAVLYLAMRAGRPVVVYAEGWCERMVHEFGCGLCVDRTQEDLAGFIADLPLPGTTEYASLIEGVKRFREAHRAEVLTARFLASLGFELPDGA